MIKNIESINILSKQINYIIDMLKYIKKSDINKYSNILVSLHKSSLINLFMENGYQIANINHILIKHSILHEEEFKEWIQIVYPYVDYDELIVLLKPCTRDDDSILYFSDILDTDSIYYDIIYRIKVYTGISIYYNGNNLDLFCKTEITKLISYIDKHILLIKQKCIINNNLN
jgi:hypothetical protein